MGSINIKRRLEDLETRNAASRVDEEERVSREVMQRLIVEELQRYVSVLRRMKAGESPGEEDGPILQRVEELYEEVRNGL